MSWGGRGQARSAARVARAAFGLDAGRDFAERSEMALVHSFPLRRVMLVAVLTWLGVAGEAAEASLPEGTDWPQWRGVRRVER